MMVSTPKSRTAMSRLNHDVQQHPLVLCCSARGRDRSCCQTRWSDRPRRGKSGCVDRLLGQESRLRAGGLVGAALLAWEGFVELS